MSSVALAEEVSLPLPDWQALTDAAAQAEQVTVAPHATLPVRREISGRLDRGVFSGQMTATFVVSDGHTPTMVPLIDASAAISSITLDGRRTSLLSQDGMIVLPIETPGLHRVEVGFLLGKQDDRFARKLAFRVPDAGISRLSIEIPEQGIDAALAGGAIVSQQQIGDETRLVGLLDGQGQVDLSWQRAIPENLGDAQVHQQVHTLLTLQEGLVRGLSVVSMDVREGATDRLRLALPEGVEIVDVTGDAVLQWRTGDELEVRLRYLVEDQATVQVHFQLPAALDAPVPLRMPLPLDGALSSGVVGVQGPAGLQVSVDTVQDAEALTPRDLPTALTGLTQNPLLLGFRFDETPEITLRVAREEAIELISTVIDDVQASTVVIEDGTEATKMRMRIRNNVRQFLRVRLPDGSTLTQARIGGEPVRPAVEGDALLLPLRQSVRIGDGQAVRHTVASGETLGGIAVLYYSDSSAWRRLFEANGDQLDYPDDLEQGMTLRIPPPPGANYQESSFVVELAYQRDVGEMGLLGRHEAHLPQLDVDVMAVNWHLYLPEAVTPLRFDANLTQRTHIRYGLFRRAQMFFTEALRGRQAWAGGGSYSNILARRKIIYRQEASGRNVEQEVTRSFPLVGKYYRFVRLFPGQEAAQVTVAYLDAGAVKPLRWLALMMSFILTGAAVTARRRSDYPWRVWGLSAVGMAGLLVLGHHVLGVNRRIVWGADLALLFTLVVHSRGMLRKAAADVAADAADTRRWLSWRNLGAVAVLWVVAELLLNVPMLWSLIALAGLLFAHRSLR